MLRPLFATLLLYWSANVGLADPAERLARAVQFKTISHQDEAQVDYQQFRAFNAFLRSSFPEVFSRLQVDVINGYSLLLHWPGSEPDAGAILFTAHTDVVPIEPDTEDDWEHPPFAGVIADDTIFGRGTLDDKVGVLGLLEAAGQLLKQGFTPRKSIVLAFGHDEEIGGRAGAAQLALAMQARNMHFDWMVDEGGMIITDHPLASGTPVAMINIAEKGYLTLVLEATGPGGHSSSPPSVSTIGRLSRALDRIENHPLPPRLVSPVQLMLETLAPYAGLPTSLILDNLWLTSALVSNDMAADPLTQPFVRTTTALTMFNAGVKENVVPQRAEARINVRLLPGDSADTVIEHVTAIVDDPQVTIRHEPWNRVPPIADHEADGFAVIMAAVLESYPEIIVTPSLLAATTDTRHYIDVADNLYRFHGVTMSTEDVETIHGSNEKIAVANYLKSIEVAARMMQLGAQ